jgi:tetratricopeptide (TPR) repeat protein
MRATLRQVGAVTACCALLMGAPAWAQYREYYVKGKVVDAQKQPVPGVEIRLRDVATSRGYNMKTDKDGAFKLAGLPHGVYEVTFEKQGYSPKRDEWKFEAPQDTMRRVEVPDVILVSSSQAEDLQRAKDAEAGIKTASERIRAGDLDGAIALLRPLLEKDPEDMNALYFIGLAYGGKKMCKEAVAALTRVTERGSKYPGAYFELGVCYRQLGDLEKSLEAYDKHLELDPTNADSAYNSGLILFETNRIDEALVRFERGLAAKPEDAELLEMVGRCHIHQANFQKALEYLERARAGSTDPERVARLDGLIGSLRTRLK